jgi:hypothetical protein
MTRDVRRDGGDSIQHTSVRQGFAHCSRSALSREETRTSGGAQFSGVVVNVLDEFRVDLGGCGGVGLPMRMGRRLGFAVDEVALRAVQAS